MIGGRSASVLPADQDGSFEPALLVRGAGQGGVDGANHVTELAEVSPDQDDAARVLAAKVGPVAEDVGEVLDVVSEQDAAFLRRQVEDVGIVETLQALVL